MKKSGQKSRLSRFKRALYNPEKKEFLGRTCREWVLVFIFYAVSYTFLAAFFVGMLSVFLYGCLNNNVPSLTGEQSILRGGPVGIQCEATCVPADVLSPTHSGIELAVRPKPYSTFIQVAGTSSPINKEYVSKYEQLTRNYENTVSNENCGSEGQHPKDPNVPCSFNTSLLGECMELEKSLNQGKLCLYLKMNRIYGWLPDIKDSSTISSPAIECRGTNEFDREALGPVRYFPEISGPDGKKYGSISNNYFPYLKVKNYQAPLVAVQFPNITRNTVVLVECRLVGLKNSDGSTNFEVCVDDK